MPEEKVCCFTGHRANKLPWGFDESAPACTELKKKIAGAVSELYGEGYRGFICGMANGCDMYFGEAVLSLKEAHPDVKLEAAVPCDSQSASWGEALKARYERILRCADTVTYVQHTYTRGCMMRRNRYMVDRSSALLACFDGQSGGTMATILMAQRAGLDVRVIDI